jgi:uncharacterized protein YecT (DUF1311 family)
MRAALLLLAALAGPAAAQYAGPAVETCRAFAKREAEREGTRPKDIVFERDQNLMIDRYTRKLGSQFVASVLRGNGAVVFEDAPSAELSFTCLLADDKRAVYFEWLPRPNARALAQCSREAALRQKPKECLGTLLQVAEMDLTTAYAGHFQEARERDHAAGNESAVASFRKANDEWRQYRDAECARQAESPPKGVSAEDHRLGCMVDLTRRRALDMR